jgi:hypothetical protein
LRNDAKVFVSAERSEMGFLVPLSERLKNLIKGTGLGSRYAFLSQVDTQGTGRGAIEVNDVERSESHAGLLVRNIVGGYNMPNK